jgi:hypothetical protein
VPLFVKWIMLLHYEEQLISIVPYSWEMTKADKSNDILYLITNKACILIIIMSVSPRIFDLCIAILSSLF